MDPEKNDTPTDISKNDTQSDSKPVADHVESGDSGNETRVSDQTKLR